VVRVPHRLPLFLFVVEHLSRLLNVCGTLFLGHPKIIAEKEHKLYVTPSPLIF
jgi:hypothetical protein